MNKDDARTNDLATALEKAERRLADRETLLNAAIGQAETARAQYEQANERAESLRRKLTEKEELIVDLKSQLQQATVDLAVRDAQIAELQRKHDGSAKTTPGQIAGQPPTRIADEDDALKAIDQSSIAGDSAHRSRPLSAMGIVLQPLDDQGTRHRLEKNTTTLGRSAANDIRIPSVSVSRFHARIVLEPDAIYLIDLQSTNGCRVNGERISRHAITDTDVIEIGHVKFKVILDARSDAEDRSMDETYPLLNDSAILIPAPKSKTAESTK